MAITDDDNLPHPLSRNLFWTVIQIVLRLVFTVCMRFRARGIENVCSEKGGLFLINHQSSLDPLLVGLALSRPVSYLARHTLFREFLIGWIMRNTYVIPINRDAAGSDSIRSLVKRMRHGFLVGIFPEGTRTRDGSVGELKAGFIAIARRCDLPIYAVGIAGGHLAMPRGYLLPRPSPVTVVFSKPWQPEEFQPLAKRGREEEFIGEVRSRIVECQTEAEHWRQQKSAE